MPDGLFAYQKSQVWYILDGLGMKDFGINQCHSVCISQFFWYIYGMAISYTYFVVVWGFFSNFGLFYQGKSGSPATLHMYKQTSVHPLEFLLVRVNPFFPLLLRHSIR
jgi:hypothetical protein